MESYIRASNGNHRFSPKPILMEKEMYWLLCCDDDASDGNVDDNKECRINTFQWNSEAATLWQMHLPCSWKSCLWIFMGKSYAAINASSTRATQKEEIAQVLQSNSRLQNHKFLEVYIETKGIRHVTRRHWESLMKTVLIKWLERLWDTRFLIQIRDMYVMLFFFMPWCYASN